MAINYQYNYAEIDPSTNMCIGVHTGTGQSENPYWVEVPYYSDEYMLKYYSFETGKFYYDAEMTQEFVLE